MFQLTCTLECRGLWSVTEEVIKAQIKTVCSIFFDGWYGGVDLHQHRDKPIDTKQYPRDQENCNKHVCRHKRNIQFNYFVKLTASREKKMFPLVNGYLRDILRCFVFVINVIKI